MFENDLSEEAKYSLVILTENGYIKRENIEYFSLQKRGGCGISGITLKEGDKVSKILLTLRSDDVLFFTTKGKILRKSAEDIYEGNRFTKGKHISEILKIDDDEKVTFLFGCSEKNDTKDKYFSIVTKYGIIKRTSFFEYENIPEIGFEGISLDENDEIRDVCITRGEDELIVATKKGYAIRFKETDVREFGRTARGVRAIELREGDEVVGMEIVEEGKKLLTISEGGKGRRSEFSDYSIQNRGGKGLCNYRNSGVIVIKSVTDDDNAILIASDGKVLCIAIKEINVQFRGGSGICVMKQVSESSKIADVVIINKKLH